MITAHGSARSPGVFVGVDWGTSSFRGWLLSPGGEPLAETRSSEGMLHCASTGFAAVLRDHLGRLGAPSGSPVLICGMAGARQGWREAPYLSTPAALDTLHAGAVPIEADRDIRILPGVAQPQADRPDVMRGEETQLLGGIDHGFSGIACLPGTHSKWVRIEAGRIVEFSTYMTGELFSVLSQHSILGHALDAGAGPAADGPAFREGLSTALSAPTALTASLFRLRAAQLLGLEHRADGSARLSGLLIGSELADALQRLGPAKAVRLICAGPLGKLYAAALRARGCAVTMVEAEEASRRGLARAAMSIWRAQPT